MVTATETTSTSSVREKLHDSRSNAEVRALTQKLLSYCRNNSWAGYEPYDVLNSRLFTAAPFLNFWFPRLALTQLLKRSPINLRRLLLVPKTQNPKALGLFLTSFVNLSKAGFETGEDYINQMIDNLVALRSRDTPYYCWGYNFPWQTRTVLVPRWSPNLVCTMFAASGLFDAYELRRDERCLEMALSAAEYILEKLYWDSGDSRCGFGYPLPEVRNQVHNANLLAAALFCRVYKHTGQERFLEPALKVTRYTMNQQHADGGWAYGEAASQAWIDNFHTGFNLSALRAIGESLGTDEFEGHLDKGLQFYRDNFFREDGAVGYYTNQFYPIDTHCVAQSVITLLDLKDLREDNAQLAQKVLDWAAKHMWDEKEGYFYYRILRFCTIRTSYMRWTQAWMFLALSRLLLEARTAPISRVQ